MKILSDIRFLLNYYDGEDLQYFFEQLQTKLMKFANDETFGNNRLSGYVWQLMSVCIERARPQSVKHSRMSKKRRVEFKQLAGARIDEVITKMNSDPTTTKKQREDYLLSIYSLKLLIAISEQDEIF